GKMSPPSGPSSAATVSVVGQNPLCTTLTSRAALSIPRPRDGGFAAQLLGVPDATNIPNGFCVVRNAPRSVFLLAGSQGLPPGGVGLLSFGDMTGGPQPGRL